ncbi:MAG TPA: copper resistance protein CopC [Anaerolineales bacterium]|nr:copper resistance protein CopC [Anaerolineales bacterium]
MKSRLLALALALGLALTIAVPVLAHATLLRSIPEANAALDRAPAQIELFFSEALEPSFSSVIAIDSNGVRVDNYDSRVDPSDPTHLTASLRSLPDGVYTVSWKALSAVDGHVTTGAFPFAAGNVDAAALAAADQASRQVKISVGEIIGKWLLYISATALAGGTLFVFAVWQPVYQSAKAEAGSADSFDAPWQRLASIALTVLLVANIIIFLIQAGQASGSEIAAPWSSSAGIVLFNTRFGAMWIARLALALAIAGLLPEAKAARDRWIAFGLALLILLTISLGSHAAADPKPIIPVAADWIHLLAASVWVGGLTHFVAGMWASRRFEPPFRTRLTARLIPRFSALALVSVGALALTGLYSAVLRVGSLEALNTTLYGRALIVKLIIILPMITIGAVNLLGITPAMKKAAAASTDTPLVSRFHNIITGEVTLGALLFLSVGVLTSLPPAQTTSSAPAITASADVDDLKMDLEITPGRVGLNTFTLTLTSGGQPVLNAKEVALRFTPASGKLPPSEAVLSAQGNGKYSIKGSYLSLPDNWQVQAVVRREGKFDAFANFDLSVGSKTAGQSYPWHRVGGGLLLGSALAYLLAFGALGRTRNQLIGFGLVPALALALVSVVVFYTTPSTQQGGLVNPIPPNADSVATGKALFQTNCVPCHGETGKGDGPVGLTLNPRPADLTLHATPGVHTDGQLYLWVSDGFPGSVMPAFRKALSDEERWHLVNFIRTMAPK